MKSNSINQDVFSLDNISQIIINNNQVYKTFGLKDELLKVDDKNIALLASIREGKTTSMIKKLLKDEVKFLYICRTHELCKNVIEKIGEISVIMDEEKPDNSKRIGYIHIAGYSREINYSVKERGKNTMIWSPEKFKNIFANKIYSINHKKYSEEYGNMNTKVLCNIANNIIDNIIETKYGKREYAHDEEYRGIITVPELAIHFDPKSFDVVIIDEVDTLKFFLPEQITLFEYERDFGRYIEYNYIEEILKEIPELFKNIEIEERDKRIIVYWLLTLNEKLTNFKDKVNEARNNNKIHPEKEVLLNLENSLTNLRKMRYPFVYIERKGFNEKNGISSAKYISGPNILQSIENIKLNLEKYEQKHEIMEFLCNTLLIEKFNVIPTKNGAKIVAIPNKGVIHFKEWLSGFKNKYLILPKSSELHQKFFEFFDEDYRIIKKNNFRLKEQYVHMITDDLLEIAKINYENGIPTGHIVGRKKDGYKLLKQLQGKGFLVEGMTKEMIKSRAMNGDQPIIYQNSHVSKGVDLPFLQCMLIHSYFFSSTEDNILKDIRDELEQSVMRFTPVNSNDPFIRLIIWKKVNRRSFIEKEFVKKYIKEIKENDENRKNIDYEYVFKSNFLPFDSIDRLPIEMTIDSYIKKVIPNLMYINKEIEDYGWDGINWPDLFNGIPFIQYKQNNILKNHEKFSLLKNLLIMYAKNEKEIREIIMIDNEKINELIKNLEKGKNIKDKGKKEIYDIFKRSGIKNNYTIDIIIKIFIDMKIIKKYDGIEGILYSIYFNVNEIKRPQEEPDITNEIKDRHTFTYKYYNNNIEEYRKIIEHFEELNKNFDEIIDIYKDKIDKFLFINKEENKEENNEIGFNKYVIFKDEDLIENDKGKYNKIVSEISGSFEKGKKIINKSKDYITEKINNIIEFEREIKEEIKKERQEILSEIYGW